MMRPIDADRLKKETCHGICSDCEDMYAGNNVQTNCSEIRLHMLTLIDDQPTIGKISKKTPAGDRQIVDERGDLIVEIGDGYLAQEIKTEPRWVGGFWEFSTGEPVYEEVKMSKHNWQMVITIVKREEEDHEIKLYRKSTARRRYTGCRAKQRTRSDRFNQQTGGD